jgi:hypothetical protein
MHLKIIVMPHKTQKNTLFASFAKLLNFKKLSEDSLNYHRQLNEVKRHQLITSPASADLDGLKKCSMYSDRLDWNQK